MTNGVRRIGLLLCGFVGAVFAAGTAQADLLIQLSPTELSLAPGQCGKVTITSQPQPGFPEGAAKIRYVINRISGVDVIEAKTAGPDFPPVVLLTPVHNAEPGAHSMTITALISDSAGNQIGDKIFPDAFTITIEAPAKLPEFSFTIPESVDVTAGQELDVPLALQAEGFQGMMNVQAHPPPGISIDQPRFTISAGEEKMIHVRVAADAPEKGTLEVQAQTSLGGQMILKVFRVQVRVAKAEAAPVPPTPQTSGPVIGSGGEVRFELDSTSVNLPPEGGQHPLTLTIASVNGSHGTVTVDTSTTNAALSLEGKDCTLSPYDCVHERVVEIEPNGEVKLEFFVVATAQVEEIAKQMNGARSLLFLAKAPGLDTRRLSFIVELRAAPTPLKKAYTLSIDPPSLELDAGGEARTVEIRLTPAEGFNEGVGLTFDGYNTSSPVELKNFGHDESIFQAGQYEPKKVIIQAREGAKPGPFSMTVRGTTTYQDAHEQSSVKLPITIKEALAATLKIEAGNAELFYPAWKDVKLRIEGSRGYSGPVTVKATETGPFEVVPDRLEVASLPATVDVRVRLRQAVTGNTAIEWTVYAANERQLAAQRIAFTALDPKRGVTFTAPAEMSISPGEEKSLDIVLRGDTFKGPVDLILSPSSALNVIGAQVVRTGPVSGSPALTLRVRAKPDATIGEGGQSLRLNVKAMFGSDEVEMGEHSIRVLLVPSGGVKPVDFNITVSKTRLDLLLGTGEKVTVNVQRNGGWAGPIDFEIKNNDHVTVNPEKFRLEGSQNSQEIEIFSRVSLSEGSEDSLIVTATPYGGGSAKEAYIGLRASTLKLPEFTIATTQPSLRVPTNRPGRITVRVAGVNGWNGPVTLTVADKPEWSIVQPESVNVASLPAEVTFEVTRTQDEGDPSDVVFWGTAGTTAQKARIPVQLIVGGGQRGQRGTDDGPFGGFPAPEGPLLSLPQSRAVAGDVRSSNSHVEGLAQAMSTLSGADMPAAIAMLQLYEALLAEGQRMAGILPGDEEREELNAQLNAEVLASQIEEYRLHPAQARFQTAMVGGFPGFFLIELRDFQPSDLEDIKIEFSKPVNWATASNKVELLILQMRFAQKADQLQEDWTGPARERVGQLSEGIDSLAAKLDEITLTKKMKLADKVKFLVRPVAIAGAIFTTADIVARSVVAFLPNQIKEFYAQVDNQHRVEDDKIFPVIKKGKKVPVKVFILTKNKGGRIVSPKEVADFCYGKVTESQKFKDWFDKKAGSDKAGGEGISDAEREKAKDEIRAEFLKKIEKIAGTITGLPPIKEWLESGWDVASKDLPAIEVNSNRVLTMESLSPAVLAVREAPGCEGERYCMEGLVETRPGETAGYFFAFRNNLRNGVLSVVPGGLKVNVKAAVMVKDQEEVSFEPCWVLDGIVHRGQMPRDVKGAAGLTFDKGKTCSLGQG